jgi:hypothetical protein
MDHIQEHAESISFCGLSIGYKLFSLFFNFSLAIGLDMPHIGFISKQADPLRTGWNIQVHLLVVWC